MSLGCISSQLNISTGDCYIQVSMLDGGWSEHSTSNLENWDFIWGRADAIRQKCVAGLGVGGSAKAGKSRSFAPPNTACSSVTGYASRGGTDEDIGIFVSGARSKTKTMLDMKFGCIANADGSYSCEDESGPPAKKPKTSPPSSPESPVAPPATNRLHSGAQSGSCLGYKDCDHKNGYTCAKAKTASDDFPVDASFLTFTCQLAKKQDSGVVAAAVAAVAALGSVCRGRCTLDINGTLHVPANSTINSSPSVNAASSPMLVGPCNCTYVSEACVLSETGIVYEDPSAKINAVVGAPNGTVCCDGTTGLWKSRSGTISGNASNTNPICPAASGSAQGRAGHSETIAGIGMGVLLTPS